MTVEKPSLPPPSWQLTFVSSTPLQLSFRGNWTLKGLQGAESQKASEALTFLDQIPPLPQVRAIEFFLEENLSLDTLGAWILLKFQRTCEEKGLTVNFSKTERDFLELLENLKKLPFASKEPLPPPSWGELISKGMTRSLENLGAKSVEFVQLFLSMLAFLGEFCTLKVPLAKNFLWRKHKHTHHAIRWVSVFQHVENIGLRALPIVGLTSFLIGMVLTYQGINQLRRFGAEIFAVDFLGVAVLREIAVLITSIIVAGRSGSAFTAQIGTMILSQEVDALRVLGFDPFRVLVLPRILALLICLPLLVFFSNIMNLLGGMLTTALAIDLSPAHFILQFKRAVSASTFWVGMSKAPLFALLIGLVGCFRGFQVKTSTESVGKMTTQSVVESIFLVIVCDAFMSILFSFLKI